MNNHRIALCCILGLLTACAGASPSSKPAATAKAASGEQTTSEVPTGKLPRDVRPLAYDIRLKIDPDQTHFSGQTSLELEVDRELPHLWLHGKGLEVERVTLVHGDASMEGTYEQVHRDGVAKIAFTTPIPAGKSTLTLTYTAPFDEQLTGLYRVKDGEHYYAFTQFQPISARQVFPSFDEPYFKTPFKVQLTARAEHEAIANTPVTHEEQAEGWRTRSFQETKPLPAYLVAFAVGPFDVVDGPELAANSVRQRPLPFRGIATQGKGAQLAYAMEHTQGLLDILEEYFASEYPFEKLDIVAVPDFAAGAMENVGLVTFREELLLLDPDNAPVTQKRRYANVMAHELAHMWFGNTVTMPWWDDLWLNEAFATWMAHKVVETWDSTYDSELSLYGRVLRTMGLDSLEAARQIREPIEYSHDIMNAFDGITYAKGGGVLTMFERYLGEELFREGVRYHMRTHRFSTATVFDYMESMSKGSGKDIREAFQSFLLQPGVPHLGIQASCQAGKMRFDLQQSRYLPAGSTAKAEQLWKVPFCVRLGSGEDSSVECTLLEEAQQVWELPLEACPSTWIPNADGAGYYRYSVDEANFSQLVHEPTLNIREQLAAADALLSAYRAGRVSTAFLLPLLPKLASGSKALLAVMPVPLVEFVAEYAADAQPHMVDAVRAFTVSLYRGVHQRLEEKSKSPEGLTDDERLLLADVIRLLAFTGQDKDLRAFLKRSAEKYIGYNGHKPDLRALPRDVVPTALGVAVQDGAPAFFDAMLALLKESNDGLLRRELVLGLAATTHPEQAASVRDLVLTDALRSNERATLLFAHGEQPKNREALWLWLQERFDDLVPKLPDFVAGYLPHVTTGFCSGERAQAVASFFEPHIESLVGGPRNLAGATEAIRLCSALRQAQGESLSATFQR